MYIHSIIGCFHDHAHHLFEISFDHSLVWIIFLLRQYMHLSFISYGFSLFWGPKDITLVLGFLSKLNWLLIIVKWFVKLLQFIACSVATLPYALIHVVCLHVKPSSSPFLDSIRESHKGSKILSIESTRQVENRVKRVKNWRSWKKRDGKTFFILYFYFVTGISPYRFTFS